MEGERPARSLHIRPAGIVLGFLWVILAASSSSLSTTLAQGLRVAILALFAVNLAIAVFAVRGVKVRVVGQPTMAVVGDDCALVVAVSGRRIPVALRMSSSAGAPWVVGSGGDIGTLPGRAHFRGVATTVVVQVRSDGPLGLLGYSRSPTLAIRPLWIGPRPVAPPEQVDLTTGERASTGTRAVRDGDLPSAVREYERHDSWRRISWPVSARSGRLMTKTFEDPLGPDLVMVVDLGPDTAGRRHEADRIAGMAAWVGARVLEEGWRVRLSSVGRDGPTTRRVDGAALHRALAEARGGPVALPDERPALVVDAEGVRWL